MFRLFQDDMQEMENISVNNAVYISHVTKLLISVRNFYRFKQLNIRLHNQFNFFTELFWYN